MKIYCASPFATASGTLGYINSVVGLTQLLAERGIAFEYGTVISSDVVINRNIIAHKFLADPEATHLVMLDTDMQIDKSVFAHFIDSNHDFMGAVYARRRIDLDKFHAMARSGKDVATSKALASEFIVHFPDTNVAFANGFTAVTGIGMGCVMIARRVFETLIRHGLAPETQDQTAVQFGIGDRYHDFFRLIRYADDSYASEDISFCRRALETNEVEIMGYIGPGVQHTGQFNFSAPYQLVLNDLM